MRCFGLALLLIAVGLVWRLVPLGMPGWVVKYGGSALWAAMVYWLVAGAVPGWRASRVGVTAASIASGVEGFKLVHAPGLDAFRLTLAGRLLLGRVFSGWDLMVYGVTIALMSRRSARLPNGVNCS